MKKTMITFGFLLATASLLQAETVAWWPLAAENGVRTTTKSVFVNRANSGTLDAHPISLNIAEIIDGSKGCPVGTNAFPAGWGVWDPETRASVSGETGLNFTKTTTNGALRVSNTEPLRLQSFTFEAFVKMNQSNIGDWNCIAVMPGKLLTSNGQKVLNCDSWGIRVTGKTQFQVRFTKPGAMATDITNVSSFNSGQTLTINVTNPNGLYDGKWHHLAFVVSQADKKAHGYYDYAYVTSVNLPEGLSYGTEDLYIGSTPQTSGAFGGTLAHVRISDKVLKEEEFLHLTDLEGEAEDVVLHADFETPEGFSVQTNAPLNRARGSFLVTKDENKTGGKPGIRDEANPATEMTYASLIAAVGVTNAKALNCLGTAKTYASFTPDAATDFRTSSFTVECFYRTTQAAKYTPLIRRRGGSNVQFNIGFGGTAGTLSATVLGYWANTPQGESKSINDTKATNDDQWHHAALVVDAARKEFRLFRDGEFIGVQTYSGTLVEHKSPICLGGITEGDAAFKGQLDDVRITMRALKPGEFLTGSRFDTTQETLGWVGFEDSVNGSDGVLTDGTAAAATAGGFMPAFVAHKRNPRLLTGDGTVLREDNVKALQLDKGVVKYPDNVLLPLFPRQTIEFFVKAGGQAQYAGIVRCNVARDSADKPTWGISVSGDVADGQCQKLRIRCATQKDDGTIVDGAINEDTPAVFGNGRWHHVAFTIDQSKNDAGARQTTLALYMDYSAEPVWTKTVSGWLNYGPGCASVWLGASSSQTAFFKGRLDELRISQGLLTPNKFLRVDKNGMALFIR